MASLGKEDDVSTVAAAAVHDAPQGKSHAFLTVGTLAATLNNNVFKEGHRCKVQTLRQGEHKQSSIWNGQWIFRGPDGERTEDPWATIIITDDQNADGLVDWQDAAVALCRRMSPLQGSEQMRTSISHVAINFASMAQYPFLTILDKVKKLSLFTDGFGQNVLIKGYQSEGHDSAHPDYGNNFNIRAGGNRDFNTLCEVALQHNVRIGAHINQREAYPGPCNTHLSECHEGHTSDTLGGRFSLKTLSEKHVGCIYRTLPSTLPIAPDCDHRLEMDYLVENDGQYRLFIGKPGGTITSLPLGKGTHHATLTFRTEDSTEAYIGIEKLDKDAGLLVIDNLALDPAGFTKNRIPTK